MTRNYRLAWVLLIGAVLFGLLFAFSLMLDAVRGRFTGTSLCGSCS